jgi:hypothetical protein
MCATPHVQTWQAMGKPWIIQVDHSAHVFMVILTVAHPSETGTFLRKTWDSFSKLATVIGLIEWKTCRNQDLKH